MLQSNEVWKKSTLPINVFLKDVIKVLDEIALKIVLIINEKSELLGTVSDGDIRRGLLAGLNLESPIAEILNEKPIVVSTSINKNAVLDLMITNKIQQIPIINNEKQVVGLHLWEDLNTPVTKSNLFIIMAGGKGTRLRPHTENCPKPLLPIQGKPILEHIIERGKSEGFTNFVLAINYLGSMIEDYFGSGERFGVKIDYVKEESPLGTAGALGLLQERPKLEFIVTNGDTITDINFSSFLNHHIENESIATMAVKVHEWQNPYGVAHIKGIDIIDIEEKPVYRSLINAGSYVLAPSALDYLEKFKPCDMTTFFEQLRNASQRIIAYPIHETWLDIGNAEDFKKIINQE